MITSMRRCVTCDDLWPWPISSRSFGLDLENRVRSVASAVLNGFFLYFAQMVSIIREFVACYVFCRIWKLKFLADFLNFSALTLRKKSTVLDGFFPCLAQIIISIRECVSYNNFWPWPIFSRSFGLDLENRVRSVGSTVLDGFFPYLLQMITSMRRCVACHDLWPWTISSRSFDLVLTWGIRHDSRVWVIMRRRGVSSERRRSSCSSYVFDFCSNDGTDNLKLSQIFLFWWIDLSFHINTLVFLSYDMSEMSCLEINLPFIAAIFKHVKQNQQFLCINTMPVTRIQYKLIEARLNY